MFSGSPDERVSGTIHERASESIRNKPGKLCTGGPDMKQCTLHAFGFIACHCDKTDKYGIDQNQEQNVREVL